MNESENFIDLNTSEKRNLGVCVLLGIIVVAVGAWIDFDYEFMWSKILSTVIVGIGGSVVAAALVGFVLSHYREYGMYKRRQIFFELIGIKSPEDKVAIILPRFLNCTNDSSETKVVNLKKVKRSDAIKINRETNRYSLAFDDIVAVRHISSAFVELGLTPPRIEFDDDIWDSMHNGSSDNFKSYISIGLFSNYVTKEIDSRVKADHQRLFKLSDNKEFYNSQRRISICPEHIEPQKWRVSATKQWDVEIEASLSKSLEELQEQKDFALIAKCKAPNGRTCIIIGGGKSRGTRKAASFFRSNWSAIYNHPDLKGNIRVCSNSFAGAYELDAERGAKIRERGFRIFQS